MNYYYRKLLLAIVILFTIVVYPATYSLMAQDMKPSEIIETCVGCHDDKINSLKGSTHRIADGTYDSGISCVNCHFDWKAHVDDPTAENITAGPESSMADEASTCSSCHENSHQTSMATSDPHNRPGFNCSTCHTIHDNSNIRLTKTASQEFCLECHTTIAAQFKLRSSHPFDEGNIKCTDCHKLSSMRERTDVVGLNWDCQNCHDDKSGPYIYEHPVTYNHLVNGGYCTECHNPHGSPNERLLVQPDNGICLQCHMIPAAHRTKHSGLGTKMDCVDCHTEIHGSFDNKYFLDPDLGTRFFPDCYQSGCHIVDN